MKKRLVAGLALVVASSVAFTMALAQDATRSGAPKTAVKRAAPKSSDGRPVSKKSAAARTALCKADCRPNTYKDCGTWGCVGMHGLYRDYNK